MENKIKAIKDFFRSRKLTLWLLVVITLSVILGSLLPQQSRLHPREYAQWKSNYPTTVKILETLDFHQIFTSWWFTALLVVLLINLLVTFWPRWKQLGEAWKKERQGEFPDNLKTYETLELKDSWESWAVKAKPFLHKKGYKIKESDGVIYAHKRLGGAWGTLIFHGSFLILLLGVIISMLTRFEGQVELVEGQAFQDQARNYIDSRKGLLARDNDPRYGFGVEKMQAQYWAPQQLRFIGSKVKIFWQGREVKKGSIGYNDPLEYGGYTLYQGRYHGWAALFGIRPPGAKTFVEGYVNFPPPPKGKEITKNDFIPPYTNFKIIAYLEDKKDTLIIPEAIDVKIDLGEEIKDGGRIKPGESLLFEQYELKLLKFSPWSSYFIVRDKGIWVVYTGFWTALGALILLFLWVPQRIMLTKENEKGREWVILAGGTGRYEPTFREELKDLISHLKAN